MNDVELDARPTKEFFISMLVKDIELIPAIIDLVDNSVDAAKAQGAKDLSSFWIRLEARSDHFRISDNCGGIPLNVARDYAFRFGRPSGGPTQRHSVGQFGVGMKRALFKLGSEFIVRSRTRTESWSLHVDVEEWRTREEWPFTITDAVEETTPKRDCGTEIEVLRMHDGPADDLKLAATLRSLGDRIRLTHTSSMAEGLSISLNGIPLELLSLKLLASESLIPANVELEVPGYEPTVQVRLVAGLSSPEPIEAGWYLYCNGRLVLGPDRSATTGWGAGDEGRVPRFHNRYGRFRGFAMFDSDDASLLPWTTTKVGIAPDSRAYRFTLPKMISVMRPVTSVLAAVEKERTAAGGDAGPGSIDLEIRSAGEVDIGSLRASDRFRAPTPAPIPRTPDTQSIQYRRPEKQIQHLKKALGVSSARAVGETSFDLIYDQENGA